MTVQSLAIRPAMASELLGDPLFKAGYGEVWNGHEPGFDRRWMPAEQEAYERGRLFAHWVRDYEGRHIPLARGYLAHPRAVLLLTLAMKYGEIP